MVVVVVVEVVFEVKWIPIGVINSSCVNCGFVNDGSIWCVDDITIYLDSKPPI